jgi:hypothetical protein
MAKKLLGCLFHSFYKISLPQGWNEKQGALSIFIVEKQDGM